MVELVLLLLLGLATIGALAAWRLIRARRLERDRVTYRVTLPRGLKAAQVAAFWSAFSGRTAGRDVLVLEIVGTPAGIEHRITTARASVEYLTTALRAHLGGVRFDAIPNEPLPVYTAARELYLTSATVPLDVRDPASTSAALLAALVPEGRRNHERLVVQVVVTPSRNQPRPVLASGQARTWDQQIADLLTSKRASSRPPKGGWRRASSRCRC